MGYGSIRCGTCGRTPKSAMLVVIGHEIYCRNCLRKIRVKETGERGTYFMHTGNRCFVKIKDKHLVNIKEFRTNELLIGRVSCS